MNNLGMNQSSQPNLNKNSLGIQQLSQPNVTTNSLGMHQSSQSNMNTNNLGIQHLSQPNVNTNSLEIQQSSQPILNTNNLGIHKPSQASVSVKTNNPAQLTFPFMIYPLNKLCLVQVPKNIVLSLTNNEKNAENFIAKAETKPTTLSSPNLINSANNVPNTTSVCENTTVIVSNTSINNTSVNNSSIINNGVTVPNSVVLTQVANVQKPVVLKHVLNVPRAMILNSAVNVPNSKVFSNTANQNVTTNYLKKNLTSDSIMHVQSTQSQINSETGISAEHGQVQRQANKVMSVNSLKTVLPSDVKVTEQKFSVIIQPVQNLDPPSESENVQVKTEESPMFISEPQSYTPVNKEQKVKINRVAVNEDPMENNLTDKRTKVKRNTERMKQIGSKFFKCGICNEAFSDPLVLQAHIRQHKGFQSERIRCGYCEKIFSCKTGAFHHMKCIHGIIYEKPKAGKEEVNLPTYESDEKSVKTVRVIRTKIPKCEICGKIFPNLEVFAQHKEESDCAKVWYCCVACGHPVYKEMSEEVQLPKDLLCILCCSTGNHPKMNTFITEQNNQTGSMLPGIVDLGPKKSKKKVKKFYNCLGCRKSYKQRSAYERHLKLSHSTVKPHKCDLCDKAYVFPSSLREHRLSHIRTKTFACDKCPKTFKQKYALKKHQIKHEPGKFPCDVCGKKLKCKWKLIDHKRLHTGEKPFLCETCGRGFHSRMARILHKNTHNSSSKRLCEICGKLYTGESYLRLHQIWHRIHDDLSLAVRSRIADVPYVCEICGKGFYQRLRYENHKLNVHERKNNSCHSKQNHKIKKNPSGRIICDICGKSFSSKSTLRTHIALHEGLMRVACDKCNMVMHKQSLRRHMLKMHKTSL